MDFLGPLATVVGGFLSKSSNDEANRINAENAAKNLAFQREAAQNGIQWKVADAKLAGIAPVTALGASTFNPSPVSVGATGSSALGNAVADAGQNLGRSMTATRDNQGKADAFTRTSQQLTLQKMGLENELLASQVRLAQPAGPTPPMPRVGGTKRLIPGQSATDMSTFYKGLPVAADKIESKEESYPAIKQLNVMGVPIQTNPAVADAQDIEDRYGDFVEEVAGVGNLGADALYTLKKAIERHYPDHYKMAVRGWETGRGISRYYNDQSYRNSRHW